DTETTRSSGGVNGAPFCKTARTVDLVGSRRHSPQGIPGRGPRGLGDRVSASPRETSIREGKRPRPRQVLRLELADLEARRTDEIIDLPVQVTASSDSPPDWVDPILPSPHTGVFSQAVLREEELTR